MMNKQEPVAKPSRPTVQKLKSIRRAIVAFVKQARLFPRSVTIAINHRREQGVLDKSETERLDRIRNPSKYRGK